MHSANAGTPANAGTIPSTSDVGKKSCAARRACTAPALPASKFPLTFPRRRALSLLVSSAYPFHVLRPFPPPPGPGLGPRIKETLRKGVVVAIEYGKRELCGFYGPVVPRSGVSVTACCVNQRAPLPLPLTSSPPHPLAYSFLPPAACGHPATLGSLVDS